MKILQLISSLDPAGGGVAESIAQMGATMSAAGHCVEIASLDSPDEPFLRHSALAVHALGPSSSGYGFTSKFVPWLRANRSQYDSVIVNGLWQFHSFGAWQALRNSSTPYVLYTHGMLDPWFKKQYPLKHLKKWMYWPWAEYRVLRDAHAVLFTCEEEKLLARHSFWLYRCNEVVVSLGTANPGGEPQKQVSQWFSTHPELQGKKTLLFMGRLHPKKGCDLLVDAFAKVLAADPQWHLVMAGPDQLGWQAALQRQAEEAGIASRITWTGMIGGDLKWGALRAAEVFMLPSHQENFGIAVAESLAAGTPVLISDKVNIWREVAEDGGGLVDADTLEGTCRLLQSYEQLPDSKKREMRRKARGCFEERFEISKAAEKLQTVLSQIVRLN